jgi:predicted nucleic acid-binding protein
MSARSFFDTNVLIYTDDHDAPEKREKALCLLEAARLAGAGVVSTQVLQEYFAVATRKLGVSASIARRKVELLARLDTVLVDVSDVLAAVDLHRLHELSFWDALIVRAAQNSGCRILYSEDLQHGWRLDDLEVVNPFR